MISALYAVLGTLILIKLSFDVIRLRMQYQVGHGDGGFYELQTAIRIHGNAVEYIPMACIMLILMEMQGADPWMIHLCGLLLLVGRLLHYYGLHHRDLNNRRSGMGATYASLLLMAIANLYYLPWDQLFILR